MFLHAHLSTVLDLTSPIYLRARTVCTRAHYLFVSGICTECFETIVECNLNATAQRFNGYRAHFSKLNQM